MDDSRQTIAFARVPFTLIVSIMACLLFAIGPQIQQIRVARSADELAGKLGGTRESFDALYGEPRASGIDLAYDIEGVGLAQIQFGGQDPESPALVITLRSPRSESVAAADPDPSDWTITEAEQQARNFLPDDTELGDLQPIGDQGVAISCRSVSLVEAFGALGDGDNQCQVGYVTPTPKTVSFVSLSLATDSGDPKATPVDRCAGMTTWAGTTGKRLEEANRLLTNVSELAEDDPNAPTFLANVSQDFATLATEQRQTAVPEAATTANFHLIDGFAFYADSLAAAGDALTKNDLNAVEDAVSTLETAGHKIALGSAAMEVAFSECGLDIATPVAIDATDLA